MGEIDKEALTILLDEYIAGLDDIDEDVWHGTDRYVLGFGLEDSHLH